MEYITQNKFNYIDEKQFREFNKIYSPMINDLLFTRIGVIGESKIINKNHDLNFSIYVSISALRIIDISKYSSLFLHYAIQTKKFKKHLLSHSLTVAVPMKINIVDMYKLNLKFPIIKEQEKIAKFFSLLDKQIELWNTKLQLSELFKLYYLNNLYLSQQNFYFKPKLRFKGFEGEWNSFKLENICNIKTGDKDLQNKNDLGKYPFFVRSDNIEKIDEYALDEEAILIPGDGKIGDIFHYFNGKFNYHQRVYCLFDFNQCAKFIFYEFKKNLKRHLKSFSAKATVDSIRLPMLKKYSLIIPTINEQEKIAKFFSLLDKLDEKNEYMMDFYKKRKSFFINNLFK